MPPDNRTTGAAPEDWRVEAANRGVRWILDHRGRMLRYTRMAQVVVGLFLLLFGYLIGKDHLHLIRAGVRTSGTILDYKEKHWATRSGGNHWLSAFMPVVRFQIGDRVVQFQDWMGSNAAVRNVPVTVLYDPANPSVAMIDRPVWNWIPWAPTMAVGLFLTLVGIKNWLSSSPRN